MEGKKAPVSPTADTKQTRAPQKTSVLGLNPLSTFADSVASYLSAGDAWPNLPPALRSVLLMQRTVGNRMVAKYLQAGCQMKEPLEEVGRGATAIGAKRTDALKLSPTQEEGLKEVPSEHEEREVPSKREERDENEPERNNGNKAISTK